jgi:hypothetical protein
MGSDTREKVARWNYSLRAWVLDPPHQTGRGPFHASEVRENVEAWGYRIEGPELSEEAQQLREAQTQSGSGPQRAVIYTDIMKETPESAARWSPLLIQKEARRLLRLCEGPDYDIFTPDGEALSRFGTRHIPNFAVLRKQWIKASPGSAQEREAASEILAGLRALAEDRFGVYKEEPSRVPPPELSKGITIEPGSPAAEVVAALQAAGQVPAPEVWHEKLVRLARATADAKRKMEEARATRNAAIAAFELAEAAHTQASDALWEAAQASTILAAGGAK